MNFFKRWGLIAIGFVCSAVHGNCAPFQHPGVLNTETDLRFIREQVENGIEPWKSAFRRMSNSAYASLSYKAKPRAVVTCGPYSRPDIGCGDEREDAAAAYTHALLWYLTGREAHAKKSIELMNAWSAVVQGHEGHNAPLQSSWTASILPRAAEIIRYTYKGWQASDIERFSQMLRKAYLPYIVEGRPDFNGNWELSMIEAMIGCGVFLNDQKLFSKGVAMWRKRVPAYFYLASDGKMPVRPPLANKVTPEEMTKYWYGQTTFVDGLGQETCRDFGHLQMGLAGMIDAAETARIQGVDLYEEERKRITAAMEFHAGFLLGKPVPPWLGNGKLRLGTISTWEIAYNHYHNRMGLNLPATQKLIATKARPTGADHFMVWETLTHAELGKKGLPTRSAQ